MAAFWDKEILRSINMTQLLEKGPEICQKLGARAFMRSLHFMNENQRVLAQKQALIDKDIKAYLSLAAQSGQSSFESLQNCMVPASIKEQEIPLALSLSLGFLKNRGAARIHGGGFAGTIQVYLPLDLVAAYEKLMVPYFGALSVSPLRLRNVKPGKLDIFRMKG